MLIITLSIIENQQKCETVNSEYIVFYGRTSRGPLENLHGPPGGPWTTGWETLL